ncbi:IS66 family insertion sequence element accessory protein TnpA [Treponema sp.]
MVRTKEERRNLVEQYKSSGQTQRAFAENNGVKLKTFWAFAKEHADFWRL